MAKNLRDYQVNVIDSFEKELRKQGCIIAVIPMATGKTQDDLVLDCAVKNQKGKGND